MDPTSHNPLLISYKEKQSMKWKTSGHINASERIKTLISPQMERLPRKQQYLGTSRTNTCTPNPLKVSFETPIGGDKSCPDNLNKPSFPHTTGKNG
jgi:hypothetical protein